MCKASSANPEHMPNDKTISPLNCVNSRRHSFTAVPFPWPLPLAGPVFWAPAVFQDVHGTPWAERVPMLLSPGPPWRSGTVYGAGEAAGLKETNGKAPPTQSSPLYKQKDTHVFQGMRQGQLSYKIKLKYQAPGLHGPLTRPWTWFCSF